jgi:hypothetical protein
VVPDFPGEAVDAIFSNPADSRVVSREVIKSSSVNARVSTESGVSEMTGDGDGEASSGGSDGERLACSAGSACTGAVPHDAKTRMSNNALIKINSFFM